MRLIKITLILIACWLATILLWFVFISDFGQNYHETSLLTDYKYFRNFGVLAFFCLPALPTALIYTSGIQPKSKIISMWLVPVVYLILATSLLVALANTEASRSSGGWAIVEFGILAGLGMVGMIPITIILSFTSRLKPSNMLTRLLITTFVLLLLDILYLIRAFTFSFHIFN